MKRVKRNRGIEQLKSTYGRMFTLPWVIGVLLFFAIPFIQTVIFSFSTIEITVGEMKTTFVGFEHYDYLLNKHPYFAGAMRSGITSFLYSLPIIVFLSMFLAIILNQKFAGRLLFRAMYFAPVIIASGEVMSLLFGTSVASSGDGVSMGVTESFSANMINPQDITNLLGLSGEIGTFISDTIGRIFDLVWSCGVQIVLFIAGLQSIPRQLYEVSKVEGATKWEEFWFVTFPSLGRVTLLVAMFTMIELVVANRSNVAVQYAITEMGAGIYDRTSAAILMYFAIASVFIGAFLFLYNRFLLRRWE